VLTLIQADPLSILLAPCNPRISGSLLLSHTSESQNKRKFVGLALVAGFGLALCRIAGEM
jgi:hypothetical protein